MDQTSAFFPESSVVCAPGDYLICHRSGERCKVYRVDDLLLVKRLVPMLTDPSALLVEEHMLDSVAPAYFNEVQLVLTAFDLDCKDKSEALQAIKDQKLTQGVNGLLRSALEFSESDCSVVHKTKSS